MSSSINIWIAASDGDLESVKRFVEDNSVSPNAQDEYGYSPLIAAVSYGNIPVIEYLLSKGAAVDLEDLDGESAIFVAESRQVAELLLSHGANVHKRNYKNETALDAALQSDVEEMIAFLQELQVEQTIELKEEFNINEILNDLDSESVGDTVDICGDVQH